MKQFRENHLGVVFLIFCYIHPEVCQVFCMLVICFIICFCAFLTSRNLLLYLVSFEHSSFTSVLQTALYPHNGILLLLLLHRLCNFEVLLVLVSVLYINIAGLLFSLRITICEFYKNMDSINYDMEKNAL